MVDLQKLTQKPESSRVTQGEFVLGWEDIMRDHLDGCMSYASCGSVISNGDVDYERERDESPCGRHHHSVTERDGLAESSIARRCRSRILSRWAARQAQEMITSMERRNRESELMALASLHTVSTLDSSFLRESESPSSRRQGDMERPVTRASSILQMWRELEDEHLPSCGQGGVGGRLDHRASVESNATVSSTSSSEVHETDNHCDMSELDNGYEAWSSDQMGGNNVNGNRNDYSREQSPDISEVERERVGQIVRGWMDNGVSDHSSTNAEPRGSVRRGEWLGETERRHVRIVRDWVQMATQQEVNQEVIRDERAIAVGDDGDDQVPENLAIDHEESIPEHTQRCPPRFRGRQSLLNLLMRMEGERQRELQSLIGHHAVSDFAHRSRIQSLLRGRFLRNERTIEDERPPSIAANELYQLRQRRTVSGLREGLRTRLQNIFRGEASSHSNSSSDSYASDSLEIQTEGNSEQIEIHRNGAQSQVSTHDANDDYLSSNNRAVENNFVIGGINLHEHDVEMNHNNWNNELFNDWRDGASDINGVAMHDNDNPSLVWPQNAMNSIGDEPGHFPESNAEETVENRSEESPNPQRTRHTLPIRRVNRFQPLEDNSMHNMELRELLGRRSVSNLLSSGFRDSLDQLIQSYVERQSNDPIDWDLHRSLPAPEDDHPDHERDEDDEDQHDQIHSPPVTLPPPPAPPRQPIWHHSLHWSRQRRPEIGWEMFNEVRADIVRLQQGMGHMQRMMEACIDMQVELQRSLRQEVSEALNRSTGGKGFGFEAPEDGSRWSLVKKGVCCICCDNHIDSLLYRCGHMCSCSKCAIELVRGEGRCPLCRAPIVDMVRAYTIL